MSDAVEDDALPEADMPQALDPATVNVADRESIKRAARKGKRAEDEAAQWWREALSTPIGRRELYGLLASGHAFEPRFASWPNGFPAPEATWMEAGEQRLAFRFFRSLLRIDHAAVMQMLAENDPDLQPQPKSKR